jgi:hypothetical protein
MRRNHWQQGLPQCCNSGHICILQQRHSCLVTRPAKHDGGSCALTPANDKADLHGMRFDWLISPLWRELSLDILTSTILQCL